MLVVSSVAINPNKDVRYPEEVLRIKDSAVETNAHLAVPAGRRNMERNIP